MTQWPESCFFFQAEDGIRDYKVTGVQTCALPITSAFSTRGCPVGTSTATPWRARTSPGHARESRVTATELAKAAQDAFAFVSAQPGVTEVEVFAASNATLLTRLNYTSHIPSNGVEEPKSVASRGLGLQVVFAGPGGGASIGFGSQAAELTVRGAERALAKARQAAVVDPEFVSLARPTSRQARTLTNYHDQRLMALDDASLVESGWGGGGGGPRAFLAPSGLVALAR